MAKDEIVTFLSKQSGKYGSLLIDLLNFANKSGLKDVTEEEAQKYMKEMYGK